MRWESKGGAARNVKQKEKHPDECNSSRSLSVQSCWYGDNRMESLASETDYESDTTATATTVFLMPVTLDDWKAITASAFSNSAQQAILVQETRRECARKLLSYLAKWESTMDAPSLLNLLKTRMTLVLKEQGN